MTRKEAYILAIQNEIKAQNLYALLAKSFKDLDASRTFENLIPLEKIHEDKLKSAYHREFTDAEPLWDETALPGIGSEDIIQEPKSILEYAISREDVSHQEYLHLAENSLQPDLKALFLQLAEEENHHKTVLLTEIQRIQGMLIWYDPSELTGLVED